MRAPIQEKEKKEMIVGEVEVGIPLGMHFQVSCPLAFTLFGPGHVESVFNLSDYEHVKQSQHCFCWASPQAFTLVVQQLSKGDSPDTGGLLPAFWPARLDWWWDPSLRRKSVRINRVEVGGKEQKCDSGARNNG